MFLLRAVAWIVGLFAFVRIPWVQEHLLIPFAQLQHGAACALTGAPRDAVVVDLSCTGADVMAVTLGALLSFPMEWKRKLLGVGLGFSLLVALNTVRIGTLSWVVGDRHLFELLHLRVLPMVLVLAATAFVLYWIRRPTATGKRTLPRQVVQPLLWVVGFTLIYFLLAPSLYSSDLILRWAFGITAASARLMNWLGLDASIQGNLLTTENGRWLVTQECVLTPLIPAYFGLVWALLRSPMAKVVASLAAFPLFSILGGCRLMVLAVPAGILGQEHFVAVHAFYQIVLAVLAVLCANWLSRQYGGATYAGTTSALVIGAAIGLAIQAVDGGRILAASALSTADPQGVLAFLPAFMSGLFVTLTLTIGSRSLRSSLLAGIGLVAVALALRWAVGQLGAGGFVPHPLILRAFAVGVPLLVAWRLRRRPDADSYREQWNEVGNGFPDLGGADSTATYRRDEQLLLQRAFPRLEGVRLFKTDLWDEARNSRILQWAADGGAQAYGIDISLPTVRLARAEFARLGVGGHLVVGDVRAIPFRTRSFDGVYSMGTVEHFDDTVGAVAEIARVTSESGHVVLGVPNRHDPFLRPLLVSCLQAFGLYAYGDEKSYSHGSLERLCSRVGLRVDQQSGILFQPGWLRMLDLALHTGRLKVPGLRALTTAALKAFALVSAKAPSLRRRGYLIAAIAAQETES